MARLKDFQLRVATVGEAFIFLPVPARVGVEDSAC